MEEAIKQIGERLKGLREVLGHGLMIGIGQDMPHKMVRKPLIKREHFFIGADDFFERLIRVQPEEN